MISLLPDFPRKLNKHFFSIPSRKKRRRKKRRRGKRRHGNGGSVTKRTGKIRRRR